MQNIYRRNNVDKKMSRTQEKQEQNYCLNRLPIENKRIITKNGGAGYI
jgi:hypothetical protein